MPANSFSARPAALAAAVLLPIAASPASARPCVDYATNPRWGEAFDVGGVEAALAAANGVAYVTAAFHNPPPIYILYTYDVSDPDAPAALGYLQVTGAVSVGVAVEGSRAYLVETGGLRLADVSDPRAPVVAGFLATAAQPTSVEPAGTLAYLALGQAGFAVVDVSDPAAPAIVASIAERPATRVAVQGSRALVAAYGRLVAYDLTDPRQPVFTGETGLADCYQDCTGFASVDAKGDHAYALANHQWCIDPEECYCVGRASALRVYRVADTPQLVRSIPLGASFGSEVAVLGDRAYAWGGFGVRIFDVSDPSAPRMIHGLREDPGLAGVGSHGGVEVLCAVDASQLRLADVTHAHRPHAVDGEPGAGNLTYLTRLSDVAVLGDVAYALTARGTGSCGFGSGTFSQSIAAFDLSNPDEPRALGQWTMGASGGYGYLGLLRDIEVVEDDLYVTSGAFHTEGDLYRSPLSPEALPQDPQPVAVPHGLFDAEPAGGRLLLAMGTWGLATLDPNGGDPAVAATLPGADLRALDVDVGLAASAGWDAAQTNVELRTIDVADPDDPAFLGMVSWPRSTSWGYGFWAAVEGPVAAVGDTEGWVQLVDVSDPLHPVAAARFRLPRFAITGPAFNSANRRIGGDLAGLVLYATLGIGGVGVVDVENPYAPFFVGTIATDAAMNVLAAPGKTLVCDAGGLVPGVLPPDCRALVRSRPEEEPWPVSSPAIPLRRGVSLRADPSPFDGATRVVFELTRDSAVRLDVLDVAGRRVRTQVAGPRAGGVGSATWDGCADDGRPVPGGVYFVRLVAEEGTATRKVVRRRR
jgi:hypothetical protein